MTKCEIKNCLCDASYNSPKNLCDWHWSYWFNVEDLDEIEQKDPLKILNITPRIVRMELAKESVFESQKKYGIIGNQRIVRKEDINYKIIKEYFKQRKAS